MVVLWVQDLLDLMEEPQQAITLHTELVVVEEDCLPLEPMQQLVLAVAVGQEYLIHYELDQHSFMGLVEAVEPMELVVLEAQQDLLEQEQVEELWLLGQRLL
jgi:hypothetical protein